MDQVVFVTKPSDSARQAEAHVKQALLNTRLNKRLVVAVGGDGTLLHAIKQYLHEEVLFVGVAAGSLGLLQAIEVNQLSALAEALDAENFHTVKAPLLAAVYCQPSDDDARHDKLGDVVGYGFNDISVERQGPRAAKFNLKVDTSSGNFIGDGVIFATPLGSTAYSLAAGGPIIDSDVQDVMVVTPNNPHPSALNSSLQRPHILSKNRRIRIELEQEDLAQRPLQLAIDGQLITHLDRPINILVSDHRVNLIYLNADTIRNRIENKRLGRL